MTANNIPIPTTTNKINIIFFGRDNCEYSKRIYEYLIFLNFNVTVVWSKGLGETLPKYIDSWSGQYIICFRSYFILPKFLLEKASVAAINFHSAPAEYPGNGCLNWALYDNAKTYGATAHIMNEKIDNGTIIECRRFSILPQDNVTTLLAKTHRKIYDLVIDIATGLALEGKSFLDKKIADAKNEKWHGKARKMSEIDKLRTINPACTKDELERVIRATHFPNYETRIYLHGYEFILNSKKSR